MDIFEVGFKVIPKGSIFVDLVFPSTGKHPVAIVKRTSDIKYDNFVAPGEYKIRLKIGVTDELVFSYDLTTV